LSFFGHVESFGARSTLKMKLTVETRLSDGLKIVVRAFALQPRGAQHE